jgi:uncharacterized protein
LIREAFALAEDSAFHTAYVDLLGLQAGMSPGRLFLTGIGPLITEMTGGIEGALKLVGSLVKSFVPTITLGEDGKPVLSVAPSQGVRYDPDLEEVLCLPERLAKRHNERVVIAIDEFQEVTKMAGLEARLRSTMQHHRRVSYLMAGSQASLLRTMFTSPERPFFQFGEHIPIGRIEPLDLERFVAGRFEWSGLTIRDRTVGTVVALAEGHPHFTQYFAAVTWDMLRSGLPDDEDLLTHVVDRVASALDPGFRMFFDVLAASQKRVLLDASRNGGMTLLSEQRRIQGNLGSASTVSSALKVLEAKEILVRVRGCWYFVNPAFRLWVAERAVPTHILGDH